MLEFILDTKGASRDRPVPLTAADSFKFNAITNPWTYPHNSKKNPHFGKALAIGLQDESLKSSKTCKHYVQLFLCCL